MKKKWCDDGSCFERDAFERGSFAVGGEEFAEGLCEVLATVSAWKLENVLAPLRDDFIGAFDILDKVRCLTRTPLEDWSGHFVEGRQAITTWVNFVFEGWGEWQRGCWWSDSVVVLSDHLLPFGHELALEYPDLRFFSD